MDQYKPIVTAEDHDAGFKDMEIVSRSGRRESLRLSAPSYRQAQALSLALMQQQDTLPVVKACLPADTNAEQLLNRLEPGSAGMVEAVAMILTFGDQMEKKIVAAGLLVLNQTGTTSDVPASI